MALVSSIGYIVGRTFSEKPTHTRRIQLKFQALLQSDLYYKILPVDLLALRIKNVGSMVRKECSRFYFVSLVAEFLYLFER